MNIILPEPEDYSVKEVYAFFGLTSYLAQVCEKGLVNMAVVIKAQGIKLTPAIWEGLFGQFDNRTFGNLLSEIRKIFPLNDADEALFREARIKRNWIAHQFFADFSVDFTFEAGRKKMIEELISAATLFKRADIHASSLYQTQQKSLGLTEETIEKLLKEEIDAYEKKMNSNRAV